MNNLVQVDIFVGDRSNLNEHLLFFLNYESLPIRDGFLHPNYLALWYQLLVYALMRDFDMANRAASKYGVL